MWDAWTPFLAMVGTLLPLLWAKHWITERLQELSVRWTGNTDVALVLYFVILLPGILIHELSHWLTALAMGVRVRKVSIGPVRKGRSRKVSLGSVQVGNVDAVRASVIGLAPLLGGSAVILLIGNTVLGVEELAGILVGEGLDGVLAVLDRLAHVPDSGIWLYLIFAVSNAMLPSASDMAAVRPVLIFLGIAAVIVLVVGGVPSIPVAVVEGVNAIAGYLATAFGITLATDGIFALFIALLTMATRRVQDG